MDETDISRDLVSHCNEEARKEKVKIKIKGPKTKKKGNRQIKLHSGGNNAFTTCDSRGADNDNET